MRCIVKSIYISKTFRLLIAPLLTCFLSVVMGCVTPPRSRIPPADPKAVYQLDNLRIDSELRLWNQYPNSRNSDDELLKSKFQRMNSGSPYKTEHLKEYYIFTYNILSF